MESPVDVRRYAERYPLPYRVYSRAFFRNEMFNEIFDYTGERDGTRTHDLLIKSQLLYRLSYALVTSAHEAVRQALCRGAGPPGQ